MRIIFNVLYNSATWQPKSQKTANSKMHLDTVID